MTTVKQEGSGTVAIPADDLTKWIESRMTPGLFYTFERVKLTPEGNLEARYTFSSEAAPPPPPAT
jgi:hypothetical protein